MISNFTATCVICNYTSSINKFIDILEPEEITCGVYAWFRCPKCGYEEEI